MLLRKQHKPILQGFLLGIDFVKLGTSDLGRGLAEARHNSCVIKHCVAFMHPCNARYMSDHIPSKSGPSAPAF